MATTTTLVRTYCEYVYNQVLHTNTLENWTKSVNTIIPEVWESVFYDFPIWDESYRSTLCEKILRHFYFREIGEETVELWKLRLQQTLIEIMPYYIELWETTQKQYEHLWTRNYTEKYLSHADETEDRTSTEAVQTSEGKTSGEQTRRDKTAMTGTDVTTTESKTSTEDTGLSETKTSDEGRNRTETRQSTDDRTIDTTSTQKDASSAVSQTLDDAGTTIDETGLTHEEGSESHKETTTDLYSNTPMSELVWDDVAEGLYATTTNAKNVSGSSQTESDGTTSKVTKQTYADETNTTGSSDYSSDKTEKVIDKNAHKYDSESGETVDYEHSVESDVNKTYEHDITGTSETDFESEENLTQNVDYTHTVKGTEDTDYKQNTKAKTVTDYIREITGWDGFDPNKLILSWRDTLINIDMMIIQELDDCFFGIYY